MKIDWQKDYQGEFICPYCNKGRMSLSGVNRGKQQFWCSDCKRTCVESYQLDMQAVPDPTNIQVIWYTGQKVKDLAQLVFRGVEKQKRNPARMSAGFMTADPNAQLKPFD